VTIAPFSPEEHARFLAALGPDLAAAATLFRLFPILPDGRCGCVGAPWLPPEKVCPGPDHSKNAGKHPRDAFVRKVPDHHKPVPDGAGVGLATGTRSGGLVVIDVDVKDLIDGRETLQALGAQLGRLPATLTVQSPSGGLHLYFVALSPVGNSAGLLGPAIDTRGDGGYVVAPGSPHRRGGVYRVLDASPPALLPSAWANVMPRPRASPAPGLTPVYREAAPQAVRTKLAETGKGRMGEVWQCWRRVAEGVRAFRIRGGPGADDLPIVDGVDTHITRMLWVLANTDDWHTIAPPDLAAVCESSMSLLRSDVAGLGSTSKFTAAVVAEKWARTCERVAGERAAQARGNDIMDRIARRELK
jgi:hypothetical protein